MTTKPSLLDVLDAIYGKRDFYRSDEIANGQAVLALLPGRPEAEVKAEALEEAAAKLERLARWKFKAGERIWVWSGFGKKDTWEDRMGEKGLMLCGLSGQVERDAMLLRGKPQRRRRV